MAGISGTSQALSEPCVRTAARAAPLFVHPIAAAMEGRSTVAMETQTFTLRSRDIQNVMRPAASATASSGALSDGRSPDRRHATCLAGARRELTRMATSPGASAWNTETPPHPEITAIKSSPAPHAQVAKFSREGRLEACDKGRDTAAE